MKNPQVPVRIQKAGEAQLRNSSFNSAPSDSIEKNSFPKPSQSSETAAPVCEEEAKVEVKEVEPGIFEITVACGCGKKSIVRCESLVSAAA
jgi:hypothetical protein